MNVTVYTCVNQKYEDFILIFIHSILFHNKNCDVEIGVENSFNNDKIINGINYLKKKYPNNKIVLTNVDFSNVIPNTVRFINTPRVVNEYVYISDIDIITLTKDFYLLHLNYMKKTGLNYSNIVRPYVDKNKKRLSGLHFSTWDSYYPIPDYSNLKEILNHDEVLLYKLVEKKTIIDESLTYRPVHGIHMSPNRGAEDKLGWGLKKWKNEWEMYRKSDEFIHLSENYFSNRILKNINIIDNYYNQNVFNS